MVHIEKSNENIFFAKYQQAKIKIHFKIRAIKQILGKYFHHHANKFFSKDLIRLNIIKV